MLKRVRLNSQLLFVCWAKVKGINCSSQFHLHSFSLLRQKKIKNLLLATFRKQNFCTFVPRISLFCRLHTLGFLTSDRIITLFYCRRSNTNKKKKESKKGPRKRERERVWENRTSSIVVIVVPFHHRARRRRRAYI